MRTARPSSAAAFFALSAMPISLIHFTHDAGNSWHTSEIQPIHSHTFMRVFLHALLISCQIDIHIYLFLEFYANRAQHEMMAILFCGHDSRQDQRTKVIAVQLKCSGGVSHTLAGIRPQKRGCLMGNMGIVK